mgnify:CR=1 FL=1
MDLRKLKKLIDLVEESGISELELTEGEEKVRISRQGQPVIQQPQQFHIPQQVAAPIMTENNLTTNESSVVPPQIVEGHILSSPMVGTFYRAPSPDTPAFVDIGDIVQVGQVVCIVEAMKLMNELESEVGGEVVEILVDNGTPVEFGQVLMRVKPA